MNAVASRLHSHRGATRPHPVTERHTEDARASWPHATEVRLWAARRGHRPWWARENNKPGANRASCHTKELIGATQG